MKLNVKIKINVERKLINTEAHTFRFLDYTKFLDKSTATTIVEVVPCKIGHSVWLLGKCGK